MGKGSIHGSNLPSAPFVVPLPYDWSHTALNKKETALPQCGSKRYSTFCTVHIPRTCVLTMKLTLWQRQITEISVNAKLDNSRFLVEIFGTQYNGNWRERCYVPLKSSKTAVISRDTENVTSSPRPASSKRMLHVPASTVACEQFSRMVSKAIAESQKAHVSSSKCACTCEELGGMKDKKF